MRNFNENSNPVYDHNTIEFVTIALEWCTFLENAENFHVDEFIDRSTKLLPLLYLKTALLPEVEATEFVELGSYVSEEAYEAMRTKISGMLGEADTYLETFHQDMQYSDTPVAASIAENLCDIYQDVGDFCHTFRNGPEDIMRESIAEIVDTFRLYWGQSLLNALKALHAIRYALDDDEEDIP
jgi:hypothetical protein